MKKSEKIKILRKLYQAVRYHKNRLDSFQLRKHEESLKRMEAELEKEKKREKEIDARIIEIISKINRTRAS